MNHAFYEVEEEDFIKTICRIIEKAYYQNYKILVRTKDEFMEGEINKTLWTYSQQQFIPHGSSKDPLREVQPIYVTSGEEKPNKANLIIYVNRPEKFTDGKFVRYLYIFDPSHENITNHRLIYKRHSMKGDPTIYFILKNKKWTEYHGK